MLDGADLHLIVAIGNDAIAHLDIGGLNFQEQDDPGKELNWMGIDNIVVATFQRSHSPGRTIPQWPVQM